MIRLTEKIVLSFIVVLSFWSYYEGLEPGTQYADPLFPCLFLALVAGAVWAVAAFIVETIFGNHAQRADERPQPSRGDKTHVISAQMDPRYTPPSGSMYPNVSATHDTRDTVVFPRVSGSSDLPWSPGSRHQ